MADTYIEPIIKFLNKKALLCGVAFAVGALIALPDRNTIKTNPVRSIGVAGADGGMYLLGGAIASNFVSDDLQFTIPVALTAASSYQLVTGQPVLPCTTFATIPHDEE